MIEVKLLIYAVGPEPSQGMFASGGTTRFIEISRRLCKNRRIELFLVTSTGTYKTFLKRGIKIQSRLVPPTSGSRNYFRLVVEAFLRVARLYFFSLYREESIVYVPSDFLWDVLPAFYHKIKNKSVKWVQIIHHLIPHPSKREGSFISNMISYYAQKVSFFFIKRYSDVVIVVNPFVKERLKEMGFCSSKINVSANGIDTDYFKNIRSDKEIIYDGIFLGRLHPSKGIFDLMDIWKIVCEKKKNAKLGIIGYGECPIKERMNRHIKEHKLENNIDVLGYVENERAFSLFKSSKVFVFPSLEEGFGIATLEAMACGLPVVAYDLPVYEVFGNAIVKVPIGNKKAFAEAVILLMSNQKLRKKLSENASEVVLRYDWDKVSERELELIESL